MIVAVAVVVFPFGLRPIHGRQPREMADMLELSTSAYRRHGRLQPAGQ